MAENRSRLKFTFNLLSAITRKYKANETLQQASRVNDAVRGIRYAITK